MDLPRASGILLHPTSLPGRFGVGDIGAEAIRWIEFLRAAGQRLWQILPLGPTGYGDSPYQCFSAFAGNPYLISPEKLFEDGLLSRPDLQSAPTFPEGAVDYGLVIECKLSLLHRAYASFRRQAGEALRSEFEAFSQAHASWLDDFALFMALKQRHDGAVWSAWDAELAARRPEAMAGARQRLADSMESHRFWQFLFFRQWQEVRASAGRAGIKIIGDIPIFVAYDSADVWAHPELFHLDADGHSTVVAGVPPDYFSATGQLWGNPLYRWEVLQQTGYDWWIDRFRAALSFVDIVRLDHFRGFEAYWEIPAGSPTAEKGRWVKGPGAGFFQAIRTALGDLPIIAEDLGVITAEVVALREEFGLPGMKVLQFAFSADASDPYLPHNYLPNCAVYCGTHDNDTTLGWYRTASEHERDFCRRYLARDGTDISWDFIRLAWSSVATIAVATLQDVLSLGGEARMNLPGRASGNWGWRVKAGQLSGVVQDRLAGVTHLYGRAGAPAVDETRTRPGHG